MADVAMPRLSDSMEEGTILKWLKSDGDEVSRGDELVEIETDKANMTYEADQDGTLSIVAQEGDTLAVGETIARIGEGGAENGAAPAEREREEGGDEADGEAETATATAEQANARVEAALREVRMEHVSGRAPHQLSLGQRRRVAIATVLAMDPALLVLDEPSASLDPRARRELLEMLDRLSQTLLVVTHDLPFAAALCERAVVLSGGRIVADGRCLDILRDEDLLAAHDLELPAGFDVARLEVAAAA